MSQHTPHSTAFSQRSFAALTCWLTALTMIFTGCYGSEEVAEPTPFPSATTSDDTQTQADGTSTADPRNPASGGAGEPDSNGTAPDDPRGNPGDSGPGGTQTPEPQKQAYNMQFQINCINPAPGNLVIALFDAYPPMGSPTSLGQLQDVVFPTTVTLPDVLEGSYTAEVILDVAPFNPQSKGPEDIWVTVPVGSPATSTIVVTLQGPETSVPSEPAPAADWCGDCAPGLTCAANPAFDETYCSGEAGNCGNLDSTGFCIEDDVLMYCSSDDGSGAPISVDCKLVGDTPHVCGETDAGQFGCIDPTAQPAEPVEPEEPAEPEEPEEVIEDGPCGECAPDTTCGTDPEFPENFCSGETGTCGDLDYAGTCIGSVLYYCSTDIPNGTPISLDCSTNTINTVCKESSPGYFDCMEPTLEDLEVPEGTVTFLDVHPVLVASCSGWVCHQYNGFAQEDVDAAYDVVLEKNLAEDILDAILSGAMPAGNFGLPLCSGDPAVDTNEKCLTQEEQDLMEAWVAYENVEIGGVPAAPPTIPDVVTFTQIYPILQKGCNGFVCHDGGFAGPDINEAYDAVVTQALCEPILEQVQSGAMPVGKGCTGDPAVDATIPGCLDITEHTLLLEWVTGSDEACPGPE